MATTPPSTFVIPASPATTRTAIDPTASTSSSSTNNHSALNSTVTVPTDFTTSMPAHLPTPPFIFVPGIPNFRDMGGYSCPPPTHLHNSEIVNTTGTPPRFQFRRNLLFRCAHPTQIQPQGLMTLEALNVTDIYDLRSAPELAKLVVAEPDSEAPFLEANTGAVKLPGISRHHTPVYEAEDYSPVALARKLQWYTAKQNPGADYSEGFVNAYRDIGTYGAKGGSYAKICRQIIRSIDAEEKREEESAKDAAKGKRKPRLSERPVSAYADLNGILDHHERFPSPDPSSRGAAGGGGAAAPQLGSDGGDPERKDGGIVFHCTAGKDRTGVIAAVLLHLCGVDMEDIAWEYAITEPGLGSWRRSFIERISKSGLGSGQRGATDAKPGEGGEKPNIMSRAEAARICGSRAGNIREFLKTVVEGEWGGVEAYLTGMVGLSQEEVERLKTGLVVRVDDDEGEEAVVKRRGIEGWTLEGGMEEDREP